MNSKIISKLKLRELYYYLKALIRFQFKFYFIKKLRKVSVADSDESIDYLVNNPVSMSRYGDGEFQLVWQFLTNKEYLDKDTFQRYDEKLARRLFEILSSDDFNNSEHIVCLPHVFYNRFSEKKIKSKTFIFNFIINNSQLLYDTINPRRKYYDALITRFYLSEKNISKSQERISKIRTIWENKRVCFIEGEKSRLGVGNDLFDNASSCCRILCPSESAFSYYSQIFEAAKSLPSDTIFLIALGMTATVLAYDLSKLGFRALDVGHIDIEYEWMLMGATEKVAIPNKYTNEASGGKEVNDEKDAEYLSQIIKRIGC